MLELLLDMREFVRRKASYEDMALVERLEAAIVTEQAATDLLNARDPVGGATSADPANPAG